MRQFELSLDDQEEAPPELEDADEQSILDGLNPQQQEAAKTTDGPVLIIAGPGSGKTRTLTHRIAYLLASGKARPYQILALTFTNKAAREMQERIRKLVGEEATKGMWMGTFHSTCARLLRREAEHIGFTSDFSIYDTDDSQRLIKALMEQYHIDPKRVSPKAIQRLISGAKNQMVGPDKYARIAAGMAQQAAADVYRPYQDALRRANALDFDDLLLKPIDVFNKEPDVLEKYQQRWRYIHIDEYQDTNHAQYTLTKMLAARHRNLCVVGDDAQSIYAFRGANIENILSFQRDYKDATVVRLEQNYRSTGHILRLADSIIDHNEAQLEKELWTDKGEGEPVVLMEALSEKDEAQKVEQVIRDLHLRHGYRYRDFAVLYRTNAQSRSLEEALRRGGIRYRVVGGVSFYQRREIKDVLAYLRLIVNPNDSASLRRVINTPKRGIGNVTQERIFDYAREQGIPPWEAIEHVEDIGLSTRAENAVRGFYDILSPFIESAGGEPADEITKAVVKRSGIIDELQGENTRESLMRLENVQELINAIAEFSGGAGTNGSLSSFLQEVSLLTDLDETDLDDDRVTLMTIHASKGLEFPVVFITGLEEGLFPLSRAAQDPEELEEERRLFYVAATRAEERLFLTHARTRYRYGSEESSLRSRFLEEIDPDCVRTRSGAAIRTRPERFSTDSGPSDSYKEMDPHYYRKSLHNGGSKKRTRKTSRPASSGRRIVYDEGESEIVPGVRVEHETFGEGKVLSMEGRGEQATAVVFFQSVGQKKLKLKYARLKRIG